MFIKCIRPELHGDVSVIFSGGQGGLQTSEDVLLDRSRFLELVRSRMRYGIENAPDNQPDWEAFIKSIWNKTNPQLEPTT